MCTCTLLLQRGHWKALLVLESLCLCKERLNLVLTWATTGQLIGFHASTVEDLMKGTASVVDDQIHLEGFQYEHGGSNAARRCMKQ